MNARLKSAALAGASALALAAATAQGAKLPPVEDAGFARSLPCFCMTVTPHSWPLPDRPDPCRKHYLPEGPDSGAFQACLKELRK